MYQHANAQPVPPSERSELEIGPELDRVILSCLAKLPEDRPQSAGELSRLLAAAVPAGAWSEERAHRWWERHHPEAAGLQPRDQQQRTLTKTMDIDMGWTPVETPAPELGSAAS
jgi:hypothetical protein